MSVVTCSLNHPIHIIISAASYQKAVDKFPTAIPPDREKVRLDLEKANEYGVAVLLEIDKHDGKPRITFCTPRYEIWCGLTKLEDGYYAYGISPTSLRKLNQLARTRVHLKATWWQINWDIAELNSPMLRGMVAPNSGFKKLSEAWGQAVETSSRATGEVPRFSASYVEFLSNVETLIKFAYEAELDKVSGLGPTLVNGVEPVPQVHGAGSLYQFRLAGPTNLTKDNYVWAGTGEPGVRGEGYGGIVNDVLEEIIIVYFHQQVALTKLRQIEWLMAWTSPKQRDIQLHAVQALRDDRSLNRRILPVIVDETFKPFSAPPYLESAQNLNLSQREMIARAAHVPDLLLALGPPGTGKTHSIRSMVAQQAKSGKKILITSKSNKAVDNVLEALDGIDVIRIGREEVISTIVRPLKIDNKALKMQHEIQANITPSLQNFKKLQALWPSVLSLLDILNQPVTDWRIALARLTRETESLENWRQTCDNEIQPRVTHLQQRIDTIQTQKLQAEKKKKIEGRQLELLGKFAKIPVIGSFLKFWLAKQEQKLLMATNEYQTASQELKSASGEIRKILAMRDQKKEQSEEALHIKQMILDAKEDAKGVQDKVSNQVTKLEGMLAFFQPNLQASEMKNSPEEIEAIRWKLQDWYKNQLKRYQLLQDWDTLLQTRHQALYPTLIQTADVVGATCIGIATDARFEDLEFDLMIADEAGQIQVMDLLVPLVRAKRAILVGDHLQLPPVVEQGVVARIDAENRTLETMLNKSLFEQIFEKETTPASHKIMLDIQYRMPRIIADFISRNFYNNKYRTARDVPHVDPFFQSPMVFIDTVSEKNRNERKVDGDIDNKLEADCIVDLVIAYQDKNIEWGVIVPYKKQAERIRNNLLRRPHIFQKDMLEDFVATVDSFQGKERGVIIFGFTRSNSGGGIGFLSELRRLNVSLSRAKHQLILIGDSNTLSRASDVPFAALMKDLLVTIKSLPGGYLHVREFRERFHS